MKNPVVVTPLQENTSVEQNKNMLLECEISNALSVHWSCDGDEILPEDDGVKITSEDNKHSLLVGVFTLYYTGWAKRATLVKFE